MIPANGTDRLQPLDVSVNKATKEFLRRQFHDWYAKQICEHLKDDTPVRLSISGWALSSQYEQNGWRVFMTTCKPNQ